MPRLPYPLRALAHRDYRLFWLGQLVSRVGTWMQSVAQSWLVLELTGSPLKLGLISTLQFAPVLVFSFVGGVASDRLRKRRLIIATQIALMIQAALLALLAGSGHVEYWHVAILAAVYGVANSIDMPVRQAYVVELTGKDDLMSAIALNSAIFNAARVVGPAVAGLLIATWGVTTAFALNSISFVAVLLALLAMRTEGAPAARGPGSVVSDVAQGLRYATRTPHIALVLGLLLFVSLFVLNFNVVVPLFARDVLAQGAHGFGLLMASLGAGAMLGALAVAGRQQRPTATVVIAAAAAVSIGVLSLGFVRHFPLAVAVLMATGCAQIVFTSSVNTTIQLTAPDAMRGRMMSLYVLVFVGVTPFGAFLTGWVAEHFGIALACAVNGAAGLVTIAALSYVRHRPATAEPAST